MNVFVCVHERVQLNEIIDIKNNYDEETKTDTEIAVGNWFKNRFILVMRNCSTNLTILDRFAFVC